MHKSTAETKLFKKTYAEKLVKLCNEHILRDVRTGGRCQFMQTLCIRRVLQKVLQQI